MPHRLISDLLRNIELARPHRRVTIMFITS